MLTTNAVLPTTVLPTARFTLSSGSTDVQSPPSDVLDVGWGVVDGFVVAGVDAVDGVTDELAVDGVSDVDFVEGLADPLEHAASANTMAKAATASRAPGRSKRRWIGPCGSEVRMRQR